MQIAALRDLRDSDIRNQLGKLPESLKAAYDELYHKIQSQKESTPVIANRAFQWVMGSSWPLSPAELVAAVCQDPDTDEIDEIDIKINFVLEACQNLLVVDQKLNVCRFSHLSVQEYFETSHWNSGEADLLAGKVCLLTLLNIPAMPEHDERTWMHEDQQDNSVHDVLKYACFSWVYHLQRLEEKGIVENRLTAVLKRFLGSMDESSLAYQNWHKMTGNYLEPFAYPQRKRHYFSPSIMSLCEVYGGLSPCSSASLAIATFGFHKTILDWWSVGFADINQ